MTKHASEFENFDRTIRQLLKVPHSEIKAKLEEEKKERAKKEISKIEFIYFSVRRLSLFG